MTLEEIDISGCYTGKVRRYNAWRRAVAEMIGVGIVYRTALLPAPTAVARLPGAPTQLPFVVADVRGDELNGLLTPERRLGRWEQAPEDPLLILVAMTLPGGLIDHRFAGATAARLGEIAELMYGIDDGTWGSLDLGRFTETMRSGFDTIARNGRDVVVDGGYEPGGWYSFAG